MRRRGWARTAALTAAMAVGGCGGGGGDDGLVLDGSPRVPDDEGVATALDRQGLTLDGERTYELSDELASFSTSTLAAEPFIQRRGQYVQVGLAGDTVVWMAGFAAVLPVAGTDSVFYTGTYENQVEGRATFADGTTLRVADGVQPLEPGTEVQAQIDATTHEIIAVTILPR